MDYPSRRGEKLFRQGLSQIGHFDGLFSGSSKRILNPGPEPSRRNDKERARILKAVARVAAKSEFEKVLREIDQTRGPNSMIIKTI